MATYLPQISDYIPQIQPFKPDFNFYAGALQMKQTQYDTAYKQISGMYGSLLNSPMLRDNNIQAREDYFKAIDGDIKKISNLDLSLQQNVDQAVNLFSGIYENKNIVKDMMWTKNYQQQLQRGEGFKNCKSAEECGGSYWEGGQQALHYRADEFRKMSDEQAMGFGDVNYVAYQNVMEKAVKLAKEADLNVTFDQVQGGYIVTTKNGPALIDPLNSLFSGVFANDPAIMDYYKTKAYVDRKGWIQGNVGTYGSEAAAEEAYINTVTGSMQQSLGDVQKGVDRTAKVAATQKKELERRIETKGAIPNGTLAEQYRYINNIDSNAKASQEYVNGVNKTYQNVMDPQMRAYMGENIDSAMASILMANDIGMAATTLAYKDSEQTKVADPFALENAKQANRMALEDKRHSYALKEQASKFELANFEKLQQAQGGQDENLPFTVAVGSEGGAVAVNLSEEFYKQTNEDAATTRKDLSSGERELTSDMLVATQGKVREEMENGDFGVASQDLITMGDKLFQALADSNATYVDNTTGEIKSNRTRANDYKAFYGKWQNQMSDQQKLQYLQKQDLGTLARNENISGNIIDTIYEEVVTPLWNQSNEGNQVNRDYLNTVWQSQTNQNYRNEIRSKNAVLESITQFKINSYDKVMGGIRATQGEGAANIMEMYINPETGSPRSRMEFQDLFAKDFVENGQGSYEEGSRWGEMAYEGDSIAKTILAHTNVAFAVVSNKISMYSLNDVWAKAFTEYAIPEGQVTGWGVGSKEVQRVMFNRVDPVAFQSEGYMNTMSFLKESLAATPEQLKVAIGSDMSSIPDDTNDTIQSFISQIYNDALTYRDPKDENRPVFSVGYQRIAGGDDKWTALNIKLNNQYINKLVGTENNKGLLYGVDMTNGLTLFLDKDAGSNNAFYKATSGTDFEKVIKYSGEYKFDSFPEYYPDATMTATPQGFRFKATVVNYNENTGEKYLGFFDETYSPLGTDVNKLRDKINTMMYESYIDNEAIKAHFNYQNRSNSPS